MRLLYADAVKALRVLLFAGCVGALVVPCVIVVGYAGVPNIKSAKEVTGTQLKTHLCGANGHYSTMLRGVSYAGSDSRFDYIVLAYDGRLRKYDMFKVKAGDLVLNHHMSLKSTPTDWIDTFADFSVASCN